MQTIYLCYRIVSSGPDENISIRVSGDHVTWGGESETREILWFVSRIQNSSLAGYAGVGGIYLPETNMSSEHD